MKINVTVELPDYLHEWLENGNFDECYPIEVEKRVLWCVHTAFQQNCYEEAEERYFDRHQDHGLSYELMGQILGLDGQEDDDPTIN